MVILRIVNLLVAIVTLFPVLKVLGYLYKESWFYKKTNIKKLSTVSNLLFGVFCLLLFLIIYSIVYYFIQVFNVYQESMSTYSSVRTLISNITILSLSVMFDRIIHNKC